MVCLWHPLQGKIRRLFVNDAGELYFRLSLQFHRIIVSFNHSDSGSPTVFYLSIWARYLFTRKELNKFVILFLVKCQKLFYTFSCVSDPDQHWIYIQHIFLMNTVPVLVIYIRYWYFLIHQLRAFNIISSHF